MIGPLPSTQQINLSIVLPLRNQAELTNLLGRLYDPSSPDYRHFLSVDQFTDEFGPTAEDFEAVVAFAEANGFVVTARPANRLIVPIRGSVVQINSAFNLRMNVYQHPIENRTFYSPDREPSLDLSVPVAHVAGLDNFSLPQPMMKVSQEGVALATITGSGPGGSYLGSDMRAAYYGGTTLTGDGQVVGLLEFGGYDIGDVSSTFTNAGQTYTVPVKNVLLDGASGDPVENDAEQVLDIVQAIGMAPGLSQVRVYIGTGQDDANIFNEMASENIAKQINVSWGWYPDDPTTDDVFFQEFAAQGQSVFVASGDDGAFDAAISQDFYPSEDVYVTSVGSTHLTTNGAGGDWVSETVWNSEGYGSGGGVSPNKIPIPSWQAGVATTENDGSSTLRNEPDVAMEGDFDNYYCALGYCGNGGAGTSFAAPRWAGFMALVNQQAVEAGNATSGGIGFINPAIYTIGAGSDYSSDFHDITSGNNQADSQPVWFSATQGYDLTTGWGSANGQSLIDALAGPQVKGFWLAPSVSTLNISQGGSGTSTIAVTDAGGFTSGVTLAVTSVLPSGVTASWGTNPTTDTSVLTVTATSSASPVSTLVTITGTSGTLTETTSFTLSVHGPSFSLSSSPAGLSIAPGASGTSTITVDSLYGFTGSVKLAVTSGLPSGVTASWGTNPASSTSVLTLTASKTAAGGTANITITGTSGALTATTNLAIAITAPAFTLYASPPNLGIGQGSYGSATIFVNPVNGFNSSVNLAVTSSLPSGVTASWGTNPTSGTSVLTLTASSSATLGQYTVTVTGTSGKLTSTTTLTLGVYVPTFIISASDVNMGQGTSASSYIYVSSRYGFAGKVALTASGLPAGVTAAFSPNPTTGYSTLTLTAASSAPVGQSTVTVTGTSGSLTKTTSFILGVYAPTFTLSASSLSIGRGTSVTSYVYVSPEYGFTGSVNLSVSGLPTGVTASFIPNPTLGSSVLTFNASNTATIGQSIVTVTGTSGSLTVTTSLTLGVYAPTFTLSASGMSIGQGSSGTSSVYVNPQYGFTGSVKLSVSGLPTGVTASFIPNPTVGMSTMTLTASSSATIGQSTVTVTGTSGSLTQTTTFTLGVYAPTFTLSASSENIGQGSSATSYVNINPQYGFTGSVTLSVSGLPSGVIGSFATNPTTGNSTLTLTASNTAMIGQYAVTVTGNSGGQTVTTTFPLGVYAPTFTIYATIVSVGQGSSGTSYVYLNPQYGFAGNVSFSVSGLPTGVTASFTPNPTTGSSTVTLTASNSVPTGQYNLTVNGTSGSLKATSTIALSVYPQSFTLSAYSTNVGQGQSVTSYVYVYPQYGFAGNVMFSASGLPSGVTASFAPNPTNSSTIMTLTASNSAVVGQHAFTVTGTSGSLTVSTIYSFGIYAPGFTLSANDASIGPGGSGTSSVYVNPQYGFAGNVMLSASGLPSGVTATFTPNPTTGSSTLTLTASSSVNLGQYTVTVTGTSGTQKASTTFTLGVNTPGFTLTSYGGVTIGQGSSGTSNVYVNPQYGFTGSVNLSVSGLPSGVTAAFTPNPTTGSSTLTLTASSSAALGQYNATITGKSGAQTATTTLMVAVYAQDFTLYASSLNIGQGTTSTTIVSVNPQYGFTGNVTLAISGLPNGVTASFAPNPTAGTSTLTLTASSSAALGQYNVTVTGTSGSLTGASIFTLGVYVPSFTLESYGGAVIGQGSSGTSYVYVYPQYGFTGTVKLSATGLPAGVTASFTPNPSTDSSTLTLTASSSASLGQYTITVTGTSGSQTASSTLALGVYSAGFTLSANSISIGQGTSGTTYVNVNPQYGFTGTVNLSVSGLPAGMIAAFSPNPTTGASTLTLTANSSVPSGQYNAKITGTSGTQTASTTLALGVNVPWFSVSANDINIGQGTTSATYVYVYPQYGFTGNVVLSVSGLPAGLTAAFTPNPTSGSSTLTLTASGSAALGQYNATITGTSGTQTASTTITLGVYASTFALSASGVNIGQGSSVTSYVYVYPQYGFTGSVTLAVSGLPSGVTASFAPNPATGNSMLTLTATNTATVGQYTVTVTGSSGSQTVTTTFSLGIYGPTFTLSASSVNIGQGSSATSYVYVYSQFGFTGNVTLSVSGLPTGVTAAFTPNPITSNSVLTLTANSSAIPGQYNATITGTSGTQAVTTTLALGVNAPGFTISTYGGVSLGQGSSSTSYVYVYPQYGFTGSLTLSMSGLPAGVTAAFTPNPTAGTSKLTLTANKSVIPGQYNATITGTSGTQTATSTLTVGVYPQGFALYASAVNIGRGTAGITTVSVNPQYGFTGSVTLAVSDLPNGVTAAWGTNPATGSSQLTLTASSSAALGQYNVTVTGTSGSLTSATTFTLGVYVPDFTLAANGGVNIGQGSSGTSYVYIYPQYGFTGNVTLAASGLPAGVTATFTPNPTTGNSTLTLAASSSASLGQYNVTITGTCGQVTATTTMSVGVYAQSFTLYDWSSSQSIKKGSSGTSTIYLTPQYGFSGNVTLAASGLPSGVTASFSPTAISTGSSLLTLMASSEAAPGAVIVTVTGTSGALTASTTLTLAIIPSQTTPTITWPAPAAISYGTALSTSQLDAKTSVSGILSYSPSAGTVLDGGPQSLSVTLTPTDATNYTLVTKTVPLTVNPVTQAITFATPPSQTYGTPLTLSATASSGLVVSYASTTPTICTVSGSTVTFVAGAAGCSIQAMQTGNSNYKAAPAITRSFWVYKEAQTISFATIPSQTLVTPLALSATASSGLPVTFISTTTSVCTVSGTTATFVATGTCTIDAHQTGNSDYLAAAMVAQSFSVTKAAQTISFATPANQTYGTPLTLSATASSGLVVSYASTTPTICTVSGSTVTFVAGAAGCSIQATQAGNSNYGAATAILRSFWVYKEAQTINFETIPSQTVGTPLALSATASSGLPVTFISTTTGVCTVSGKTATFIATGTCTIDAHQAGNGGYLAATVVAQSFTVNQKAQTITFATPPSQTYGTPLTLSAAASSGLAVSYASTTPTICTVSGSTVTFVAGGAACSIQAMQTGNSNYSAATATTRSFWVYKEAQTITFATISSQTVGTPLALSATASSGLPVTFISATTGVCTVSGTTATFIAAGTCTIDAHQAGNGGYLAATVVVRSFTVAAN